MPPPQRAKFCIQPHCFLKRLIANRVAAFDGCTAYRRGLEKDHRIVAAQFCFERRAYEFKIVAIAARPVCRAVHCAPVAKQSPPRIERRLHVLQIPLHIKYRRLRVTQRVSFARAGKAALKKNRRSLGDNHHGIANLAPEKIRRRCLSSAGAACQNNPSAFRRRRFCFHGKKCMAEIAMSQSTTVICSLQ